MLAPRRRRYSEDNSLPLPSSLPVIAAEDSLPIPSSLSPTAAGDQKVIVVRPRIPADSGVRSSNNYQLVQRKAGDVEQEKAVELRIKTLGLWEGKRALEEELKHKLQEIIDRDDLFKAINTTKRKRPLKQRVAKCAERITDLIRSSIVTDSAGVRTSYRVRVLMGLFTRDVTYQVAGSTILVRGHSALERGVSLQKEVSIEFPPDVDTTRTSAAFTAGVFTCEAPFKRQQRLERSRSSGSLSSVLSQYSSLSDEKNSY